MDESFIIQNLVSIVKKKRIEKIQAYLCQKYKTKQTFIKESFRTTLMNAGHILAILIGFYASFAVTVMSVSPLLG